MAASTKKPSAKKPSAKGASNASKATKGASKAPKPKKPLSPPVIAEGEQRELLANIIANPTDKKPRLVYADLLQERGDPRGEFIILQCTRAELAAGDPRIAEIDAQCEALLKKHKKAWTALGENKGARWVFRRGFAEQLSLDAEHLLRNAALIFGAEPIEDLSIWKIDESKTMRGNSRLAPLLDLPLHHVKRLSLARCHLTREDYDALGAAKTLDSVEILDLDGEGHEAQVAGLANATLPKLRVLRMGTCLMGDDGIEALAKSQTLRMKELVVFYNGFTKRACEAIANATWAPTLESLALGSNEDIGDDGLAYLAQSPRLTALKKLEMSNTGLGKRAADIILASPVFARLERFHHVAVEGSDVDFKRIRNALGKRLVTEWFVED